MEPDLAVTVLVTRRCALGPAGAPIPAAFRVQVKRGGILAGRAGAGVEN